MAAEEILKLFDTCWFEQGIFTNKQRVSVEEKHHEVQESELLSPPILKVRSQSDERLILDTSVSPFGNSPTSVITPTNNRVQEGVQVRDKKRKMIKKLGVKAIRIRRSSSDLELEELKGFMDLGFEFSEEDKNSRLVTIVPGIQKWRNKANEEVENSSTAKRHNIVQRPYLSEAWEILEKRKTTKKLLKWRIPAVNNELTMKHSLRSWAQSVASTFR